MRERAGPARARGGRALKREGPVEAKHVEIELRNQEPQTEADIVVTATGLVLITWRLLRAKSSSWLINANLAALGGVLAVCSVTDLGAIIVALIGAIILIFLLRLIKRA